MANQGSKKKNSNAKNTTKKNTTKNLSKNNSFNNQIVAIVLFAISIIWFFSTVIDAGGLWGIIRSFLFGVFGFCNFLLPFVICAVAILMALNRTSGKNISKVIEAFTLITIVCSIVHIFKCDNCNTYLIQIKEAYNNFYIDRSMLGGGAWGAIFGGMFLAITGGNKVAALIIDFVLLFVFIMFVSGLTLGNLIRGISKPVKKIGEVAENKINEYEENAHTEAEKEKKNSEKFNLNVDLGPDPVKIDEESDDDNDDNLISFSELNENTSDNNSSNTDKTINLDDIIKKGIAATEVKTLTEIEAEKNKETESKEIDETNESEKIDEEKKEYELPSLDCLNAPVVDNKVGLQMESKQTAQKLVQTLSSFGVETRIVDIAYGPSVTRYEIQPAAGVKISKITNLADDIALNLAASGVRIEAPIPNKAAVGIEVPNKNRNMVTLREVIDQPQYKNAKSKLTVALGKDITGEFVYSNLVKMPHLLIAGTTGSGKSVCLNTMIVSILYNATPDEVKLLMIDPKQVEFTIYNGIPHLLVPVVSDPKKASGALAWAVTEMLQRYKTFSENSVRDITGYNSICESEGKKKMPQIVIFIDELSDLMMAAPNEVEDSICRLAQMARAAGMHLVIATQRPSVDVITGIIKANIPSRISLSVSSQVDSRTIIDSVGAEKLLGNGDMLYYPVGMPKPIRVQGCYISDKEVENVVNFIKKQEKSEYDDDVIKEIDRQAANTGVKKKDVSQSSDGDSPADELLPKAIETVVEAQSASTTLLQRKLKLGYARAARIVDSLEERGIIGPYEGAKPRKVLITKEQWYEMNALAQSGAKNDYSEDEDITEN